MAMRVMEDPTAFLVKVLAVDKDHYPCIRIVG